MTAAVRLDTRVQPYPWGSTTAIPRLTGRAPTGEPEAELWVGTHPRGPSTVQVEGAPTLRAWLAEAPEARLGPRVRARFGALPFLLKYLAADAPLSIQCHPDAAQARAGFDREEAAGVPLDARTRTYRDPNPKPELIVARGRFEALCGFRDPARIVEMVRALGRPELDVLLAPLEAAPDKGGLERFYRGLMTRAADDKAALARCAVQAARPRADADPALSWVVRLGEAYPGDIGVLSPLLLEHVVLQDDEALFLEAGELHAYLGGEGVEIMANSDNVVRGGLTGKHVDVPELLGLLTYRYGSRVPLRPERTQPGVLEYRTPATQFSLRLLRPEADADIDLGAGCPATLLGLQGRLTLETEGEPLELKAGDAVFVPADAAQLRIRGQGEAVFASVPR